MSLVAPFPAEAYPNVVTLYAYSDKATNDQGARVGSWDATGTDSPASVQPSPATMADAQGRVVVSQMYSVYTPGDIGARVRDKIAWQGNMLMAQGPTIDEGGMGVIWLTTCTETE